MKLYLTRLSKKKKISTKYVLELVRIKEKQSDTIKMENENGNGKELLVKLVRCFLSMKNLLLKTPTAPRSWLRLTGIDDQENKFLLNN